MNQLLLVLLLLLSGCASVETYCKQHSTSYGDYEYCKKRETDRRDEIWSHFGNFNGNPSLGNSNPYNGRAFGNGAP